jgi:hypothetical protein
MAVSIIPAVGIIWCALRRTFMSWRLTFAGMAISDVFPGKVSRLVVLDGLTNHPARRGKPADARIATTFVNVVPLRDVGKLGAFARRQRSNCLHQPRRRSSGDARSSITISHVS